MKKLLFAVIFLFIGISLSAQIKPRPKPMKPSKENKGELLNKPVTADIALSKCERHLKYHKRMWKVLLNANPSSSNPLELSKEIRRLRFVPNINSSGSLVFDKTPGSMTIPIITSLGPPQGYNPYPVPVLGTITITPPGGPNSTLGFHWETGNYGTIKEVTDIYRIGNQAYIDVVNSNNISHTIKIFPEYLMDGCQLEQR